MSQSDINSIIRLGEELSRQRDAALDLWTWLPSYKDAVKGHGDYANEHMPSVRDIMIEATMFIAHGLNPSEEQKREAGDFYKCECGEPHE